MYFKMMCCVLLASLPFAISAQNITDLQWKKRVLLVFSPSAAAANFIEQKRIADEASTGFAERDLVLVSAVDAALYQQYSVVQGQFMALLIGKDGSEKLRSATPLSSIRLFDTIDAMPMRREEMRTRGGN